MKELLNNMLEEAKKDRSKLCKLKVLAVDLKQYEFAAELRNMEVKLFPQSEEEKKAKQEAKDLDTLFRMVGLYFKNDKVVWIVNETIKKYRKRRGNFDIKDSVKIVGLAEKYFEQ